MKARSASQTRKKKPLSLRPHSLDRINVLNRGKTRQKRLDFLLTTNASRRAHDRKATLNRSMVASNSSARAPISKSALLFKSLALPVKSHWSRHIASFITPKGKIDKDLLDEAFRLLAEYYGENEDYRNYLRSRSRSRRIDVSTFCKIMFFIRKNHRAQLFMGLHNVLSIDESRDELLKSGFHAITSYNQVVEDENTAVADDITPLSEAPTVKREVVVLRDALEDQLTASKIAMLYETYKSEVDNIRLRLTDTEKSEMDDRIESITRACRISAVSANPEPSKIRGWIY